MSGTPETQIEKASGEGLAELKSKWGWLLAWGIITILAGWFMLGHVVLASVAAAMIIGIAILVAGVGQIVQAFQSRRAGGAFWGVLVWGLVTLIAGATLAFSPVQGAVTLTFIGSAFLLAGGVWKLIVVFKLKAGGKWLLVLGALIDILLGFFLLSKWPLSGLMALGVFIGIDFIFYGLWIVMFALTARKAPAGAPAARAAVAA